RAVVPGTQSEVQLELERDRGYTSEGVARWRQIMAGSPGFGDFERLLQELLHLGPAQPGASAAVRPQAPVGAEAGNWATPIGPAEGYPPAGLAAAGASQVVVGTSPAPPVPGGGGKPASVGPLAGPAASVPMATILQSPVAPATPLSSPPQASPPASPPAPPPASSPTLAATSPSQQSLAASEEDSLRRVVIVGHVVAALLGLALGYLILHIMRPETFPLPW
ncbi:MAG TPA: hypothetical protein PLQ00_16120, partial [Thermoguttaceae bacterium]|nr:hypothetical protein [Thermoguttaceae bacterium]